MKAFLTYLRIFWYLLRNHPDKRFWYYQIINGENSFAIYDKDNNSRLTVRMSLEGWNTLSNNQIESLLQPYVGKSGPLFVNYYLCPRCDTHWEEESDCTCDDRCPECNLACTPYRSDDL